MANGAKLPGPQKTAILVLALGEAFAADVFKKLDRAEITAISRAMAKLEAVPEEMLMEVDRVLQSQLIAIGGKEGKKVGGVGSVAEILNAIDRATEEEIMADIEEESAQLADEIKQLMFVFEDIMKLDDKGIREVLKEISNEDLTMALKAAPEELREKFFKNLSERAGNMIREDLEIMGPVKLSEVEGAQQNIVKQVRRLEAEGRIVIAGSAGEVLV